MTEQSTQTHEEIEINFLDILVILAESWKLLIFGPVIAGVLAGVLSFIWPKTFESVAIVRLTEEEVALLHAAPVLDPLIERFGLLADVDGIVDDARLNLKKRLTFVVDKKTKLATITAKGRTPESAQKLGQAAMDVLLVELQPKGKEKEAILQEIAINNQLIADGINLVERQYGRLSSSNNSNSTSTSTSTSTSASASNSKGQVANLKLNNLELTLKLQTKGREVFAQEPSFPQRKASPNRALVVLLTSVFTGVVLLMFVFIRKAWNSAENNSNSAKKVSAIKRSIGIKGYN